MYCDKANDGPHRRGLELTKSEVGGTEGKGKIDDEPTPATTTRSARAATEKAASNKNAETTDLQNSPLVVLGLEVRVLQNVRVAEHHATAAPHPPRRKRQRMSGEISKSWAWGGGQRILVVGKRLPDCSFFERQATRKKKNDFCSRRRGSKNRPLNAATPQTRIHAARTVRSLELCHPCPQASCAHDGAHEQKTYVGIYIKNERNGSPGTEYKSRRSKHRAALLP